MLYCMLCHVRLCMLNCGMLSSKLALEPSKAMKFLKHLLPKAHFLYVQKLSNFHWILLENKRIPMLSRRGDFLRRWNYHHIELSFSFDQGVKGVAGWAGRLCGLVGCCCCWRESTKAVGNAVWYRRHPTLSGWLSETVRPTSETPAPNI